MVKRAEELAPLFEFLFGLLRFFVLSLLFQFSLPSQLFGELLALPEFQIVFLLLYR